MAEYLTTAEIAERAVAEHKVKLNGGAVGVVILSMLASQSYPRWNPDDTRADLSDAAQEHGLFVEMAVLPHPQTGEHKYFYILSRKAELTPVEVSHVLAYLRPPSEW